jgi:hypothetical protein
MRRLLILALAFAMALPARAQQGSIVPERPRTVSAATATVHNPSLLHASEVLERTTPGTGRRVRFEWEPVRGSTEYVLVGKWTRGQSWAMQSVEYRVSARNASSWEANHVAFEVSLPEGSHSWKLVAVFGRDGAGDFENPAQCSFEIR